MPVLNHKNCLETLNYLKSLKHIIHPLCAPLKQYGINFFTYSRLYDDDHALFLCNDNEWYDVKFQNDLFDKEGFITLHSLHQNKYTKSIFTGAPRDNIRVLPILFEMNHWNSIDLYKCQGDYIEVFHFASSRENCEIINFYINNFEMLEQFADFFHDAISDVIECAPNRLYVAVTPSQSSITYIQDDLNPKLMKEKGRAGTVVFFEGKQISLSTRQTQCLMLNARGKTAKEIARELSLSNRTVEDYFEILRAKFNCLSRRDLISLVMDNQDLKNSF